MSEDNDDDRPLLSTEADDDPLLDVTADNSVLGGRRAGDKDNCPPDRYQLVYFIFILLGLAYMLPFAVLVNAKQCYMYKLRNLTLLNESEYLNPEYQTELQITFLSYLSMACTVPAMLFTFVATACTRVISTQVRLKTSMIIVLLLDAVLVSFVEINTDNYQTGYFVAMMICVSVLSANSAIQLGALLGMASLFPVKYVQATMAGMGMANLVASSANIIMLALDMGPIHTGMAFFTIGLIVLLIALAGFWLLPYLTFAKFCLAQKIVIDQRSVNVSSSDITDSVSQSDSEVMVVGSRNRYIVAFKQIWVYTMCAFVVTSVTFLCYPVVNSAIYSSLPHSRWTDEFFTPVTCFLLFPVGDLIGRLTAGIVRWPSARSPLLPVVCCLRIGIVPLFLLCNVQPRHNLPVVFHDDWVPIVLLAVFAFSNGHLCTLSVMHCTSQSLREHAELNGSFMNIAVTGALGVASMLSLVLIKSV